VPNQGGKTDEDAVKNAIAPAKTAAGASHFCKNIKRQGDR